MNEATITKTLAKVTQYDGPASLGFVRYWVLPDRVRKSMHMAHFLETGSTNAHSRIVAFFAGMSEIEYKNWMKLA